MDKLIARAVSGDTDALSTLLNDHGPGVGRRLSINPVWASALDVEDVLQVTYMEAFLRIDQLTSTDGAGFVRWLERIAEHNLNDAIKALKRNKRPDPRDRVTHIPTDDSYVTLLGTLGSDSHTASRVASDHELRAQLDAAIGRLPESYGTVVRLYDLEGRSAPQVAHMLGRSEGAVYMMRARALQRLRELLGSSTAFFMYSP